MIINNWLCNSNREFLEFTREDFKITVNSDSNDSFYLEVTVHHKDKKIDKFFNDLNTAIIWCEGRL